MRADNEAFYDAEIAPALLRLSKQCEKRGMSFVALCEWEPGEFGRTAVTGPNTGLGLKLANVAAQTHRNIDALFLFIERYATKHGHSSAYLAMRGIPTAPVDPKDKTP